MTLTVVRFLLDDGSLQRGELVSPHTFKGRVADIESNEDGMVDVLVADGDDFYDFSVHISRIASVREVQMA